MSFDFSTLVTDRTQVDVSYVKQIAEKIKSGTASESELAAFNGAIMRGSYNYTDLNRVTEAMEYLVAILNKYGYAVDYRKIKVPHAKPKKLPDGYTKLTYIESTGTQYVDTGFTPGVISKFCFVMDVAFLTFSNSIYGEGNTYTGFYGNNRAAVYAMGGAGLGENLNSTFDTDRHVFELDAVNGYGSIDGVVTACPVGATALKHPFYLFGWHTNKYNSSRLYSAQLYYEGVLVRHYVPCINPSGEVGLYDLVTAAFFGNNGTGVFIAGDVAEEHENTALDPYRWYESDIPTASHMQQYVDNVEAVRIVLKSAGAAPKNMNGLTVSKANEIEKILINTELIIRNMIAAFIYSGQVYSGMMWEGF